MSTSVDTVKSLRYYVADDSDIMSLLGTVDQASTLRRLLYKDSLYSSNNEDGTDNYEFPNIGFKLDDDEPQLRGSDDNSFEVIIEITNIYSNSNSSMVNMQIKDRLKKLLRDKSKELREKAATLTPAIDLKVRDIAWVSAISYDDKEQGSERRHKIICTIKMTVGD